MKSCCLLQDNYFDKRDKTLFHNRTSGLQDQDQDHSVQNQDQDHSVQDQDQDRFFWSQIGLVLRPTVSDHITDVHRSTFGWMPFLTPRKISFPSQMNLARTQIHLVTATEVKKNSKIQQLHYISNTSVYRSDKIRRLISKTMPSSSPIINEDFLKTVKLFTGMMHKDCY